MEFKVLPIAAFALLFLLVLDTSSAQAPAAPPKSCKRWIFDLVARGIEAFEPCLVGGWGIKGMHEAVPKAFCLVKCIFTNLGMLTSDGKLNQEAAGKFFYEYFDPPVLNAIMPKAGPCFGMAERFDGSEYYCRSYAAFTQCAASAVMSEMVPYVVGCFGSPFIMMGVGKIFNELAASTPYGRSFEKVLRASNFTMDNFITK